MDRLQRKTKIVATLGPASATPEAIGQLMAAGADVFRLNFSHGSHDEKQRLIAAIRSQAKLHHQPVAILADLQGPKIRTGKMEGGGVLLEKGERLVITTKELLGRKGLISTTYAELPQDVSPGARILLDDGMISLKVLEVRKRKGEVECQVVDGGIIKDNKGINLPGVSVSAPSLTAKDQEDLLFCLGADIDFVALSFVRRGSDLEEIKEIIHRHGADLPVVAKIEKPEALRNFNAILKVADAVMVARGDLGVEIRAERVPLIQKKIIRACNQAGKPVITATQMLESMTTHPRPTRAETSDVANAILDGTDAVMLSAETASGSYPVEAVRTMTRIALDVERSTAWLDRPRMSTHSVNISEAVTEAASRVASTLRARAIAVFTQSGSTARLMAKHRPEQRIIAFTPSETIQRQLALVRGVYSFPVGRMGNTDEQIRAVEATLLAGGLKKGDLVVITMGMPVESRGSTNLIKVHKLGTGQFYEIF
jgi:pyruvate kinase